MGGGLLTGPYISPSTAGTGAEGAGLGRLLRIGAEGGAGIPCDTSDTMSPPRRVFAIFIDYSGKLV